MRTMGFSPAGLSPKLIAMISYPLLTVIATHGISVMLAKFLRLPIDLFSQTYLGNPAIFLRASSKTRFLLIITSSDWRIQTGWSHCGRKSTTTAVVISILLIILADTLLAHLFNTIFFG